MTKSRQILPPRTYWTDDQLALLRELYPDTRTTDLIDIIGRDEKSIYQKAHALGIRKSAAFLASPASGRTNGRQGIGTRFTKGQTSWNKGKSCPTRGRSAETQFKKGVRQGVAVKLYQPIGAERISKDGYLERKINDDLPLQKRWRAVHLVMWEAANGPLPKGHAICFKDGNKANLTLDNFELISRADLMRRNTLHNYPKEIAQLIQLRGAINRKINNRSKKNG